VVLPGRIKKMAVVVVEDYPECKEAPSQNLEAEME
jgi:hypothetical protein